MKKQPTPYFGMEKRPARIGVYEVTAASGELPYPYHFWDGREWGYPHKTPRKSRESHRTGGRRTYAPTAFYLDGATWRGLAKEPK